MGVRVSGPYGISQVTFRLVSPLLNLFPSILCLRVSVCSVLNPQSSTSVKQFASSANYIGFHITIDLD